MEIRDDIGEAKVGDDTKATKVGDGNEAAKVGAQMTSGNSTSSLRPTEDVA